MELGRTDTRYESRKRGPLAERGLAAKPSACARLLRLRDSAKEGNRYAVDYTMLCLEQCDFTIHLFQRPVRVSAV
jgi:hypothetical protein